MQLYILVKTLNKNKKDTHNVIIEISIHSSLRSKSKIILFSKYY